MEQYSVERWMLERHRAMVDAAEMQSRLDGWQHEARLAERVAATLRALADRLEGRGESPMPSPMFGPQDI
jgi:hypothetical protein